MWIFRAIAGWFRRLLGVRRKVSPSLEQQVWQAVLTRYKAARAQVREASTADELEVAHCALLAAQADLQWHLRLTKRDRGMKVRSIAESHRVYREILFHLQGESQPVRPAAFTRSRRERQRRG